MVLFPPEVRQLPNLPKPSGARRPAVFFDRDATLIENGTLPDSAFAGTRGDLVDLAWLTPLAHAAEACQTARDRGFAVVVVTNQGVVARDGATIEQVEAACERTVEVLGGGVDAVLACPFHPKGAASSEFCREHAWRKPAPGMLLAAAELFHLDLPRSWMIGDAERDIEAGIAAGLAARRCIQVGAGMNLVQAMDALMEDSEAGHG